MGFCICAGRCLGVCATSYSCWCLPGLRARVVQLAHDAVGAEHSSINRTLNLLWSRLYWPSCHQDVELYVHQCDSCTANRGLTQCSRCSSTRWGRLWSMWLWMSWAPPPTKGTTMSLWPMAYAVPDQSIATTGERLVSEMFCRSGVWSCTLTKDRTSSKAGMFSEVCRWLGIKKLPLQRRK